MLVRPVLKMQAGRFRQSLWLLLQTSPEGNRGLAWCTYTETWQTLAACMRHGDANAQGCTAFGFCHGQADDSSLIGTAATNRT